ncbi:amidohydrolase [Novisyntrophococcus fermenticellae]|uniref:amidohydrolase n=1 Tax=Novisyntrophococcus fermenticellae TaxID=2068655 RepID=UPI001E63D7D9|nr:amidohydrolase [Novisyntrophococcus fermenticellae]
MSVRFYNCKLLTMADGIKTEDGELWVEGNRITHVGAVKAQRNEKQWDRELDCKGNLLMPGFKDAHTHSPMTFLRSYADDLPLLSWLNDQVFPMEAKLTKEDVYCFSKLAIMEYLTSGITSNFDMYYFTEQNVQASVDTGFRTVLTSGLNDFQSSIEEVEAEYQIYNNYHERISYKLGFHAEYTTSRALLEKLSDLAHKYKAPVYTHNSESLSEVEQCIGRNGMTPTVYLNKLGLFEFGGGGFHCVHMSEEDLEIFREKGLYVVTNPGSNVKLASGIAPLEQMLDMGIELGIGTDGPASNNCLDMFREMFLATGLQKLKYQDASALKAESVLYMAASGGAKAMGLTECDALAEGKLADLILIDLNQPNMQPVNNIARNIVYSGSKSNIKLTMVNGRILYEDGRFNIGTDPGDLYREANDRVSRIKG